MNDLLLSTCAIAVLVGALFALDGRMREQVNLRMTGTQQVSTDFAVASSQTRHVTALVVAIAKEQVDQHRPMTIFLVVAAVLTVFMLRT